jgi:hypothetical protein
LIWISRLLDIPFPDYSKNFEKVIALMIDRLTLPFSRTQGRAQVTLRHLANGVLYQWKRFYHSRKERAQMKCVLIDSPVYRKSIYGTNQPLAIPRSALAIEHCEREGGIFKACRKRYNVGNFENPWVEGRFTIAATAVGASILRANR